MSVIWRPFCLLWTQSDPYASAFYSKQCYREAGMWLTSRRESQWLTATKGIYASLKCSQQPSASTGDMYGQSPFYQVVVGNHNKHRSSCPQVSSRLIKDISPGLCIEQNTKSSLYASWIHNSGNTHLHIHRTALVKVTHTPGPSRKLHYIHSGVPHHQLLLALCFSCLRGRLIPVPSTLRSSFCSSFPFSVKEAKPFIYIKAIVHGVGPPVGLVNLLKGRIDLGEPQVIGFLFEHVLHTILSPRNPEASSDLREPRSLGRCWKIELKGFCFFILKVTFRGSFLEGCLGERIQEFGTG